MGVLARARRAYATGESPSAIAQRASKLATVAYVSNGHDLAHKFLAGQLLDGLSSTFRVHHHDESESTGILGVRVVHDGGLVDLEIVIRSDVSGKRSDREATACLPCRPR